MFALQITTSTSMASGGPVSKHYISKNNLWNRGASSFLEGALFLVHFCYTSSLANAFLHTQFQFLFYRPQQKLTFALTDSPIKTYDKSKLL